MAYRHRWAGGAETGLPAGKVVCVGRNYADHARELGNEVPSAPILFLKPSTALVALEAPIRIPRDHGACHFETEIALLVGRELRQAGPDEVLPALAGVGLALDLTLRDVQNELKAAGHPWERAKAFDGACPVSPFLPADQPGIDWEALSLRAMVNGTLRQQGHVGQMLFPIPELVARMSHWFSLQPGDVVLTGTPAGVGPLQPGDRLAFALAELAEFCTEVC